MAALWRGSPGRGPPRLRHRRGPLRARCAAWMLILLTPTGYQWNSPTVGLWLIFIIVFYNVNSNSSGSSGQSPSVREEQSYNQYLDKWHNFCFIWVRSSGMVRVCRYGFILTETNRNCFFSPFLLFGLLVSADIAAFRTLQPATNFDGGVAEAVCRER